MVIGLCLVQGNEEGESLCVHYCEETHDRLDVQLLCKYLSV